MDYWNVIENEDGDEVKGEKMRKIRNEGKVREIWKIVIGKVREVRNVIIWEVREMIMEINVVKERREIKKDIIDDGDEEIEEEKIIGIII